MFVECIKNNGIPYLRLVEGIRVTNKNGDRTSQKKLILSIGPLSRFDDGQPDYVERLKKSFKAGHPICANLSNQSGQNTSMKFLVLVASASLRW